MKPHNHHQQERPESELKKRISHGALLVLLLAVALTCGNTAAQSVPQNAPAPTRVVTAPGPQPHSPQTQRQPRSPGSVAPQPIRQMAGNGTIEGFVYWDTSVISHVPAGDCSGLAVNVAVAQSSAGPYTSIATLSNNFKYAGQVKQFLVGGRNRVYDVCTYGYDKVPVGPNLQVTVNVTSNTAFSPVAVPQNSIISPINIINAQCNMLPHIVNPTASDLFSKWGTCQNMAFDVNFEITTAARSLSSSGAVQRGATGGPASKSPPAGTTLLNNTGNPTLLNGSQAYTGPTRDSTPGRKVELNPQPFPPRQVPTSQAPARPPTGPSSSTRSGGAVNSIAASPGQQNTTVQPAGNRGASHLPITTLKPTFHSTKFEPAIHGFRFGNDFLNDVVPSMDIRTGGLCGGMSYSALDYYFAHLHVPGQTYRPANRTTLQRYLYSREVDSLVNNLDKWGEVGFNPGGSRNGEFFNWGLQGTNGGRLEELRSFIDQAMPAVIDLQGDGGTGNHQVVAIGYDMGRYQGDLQDFEGDLKITVYDPNYPMKTRTLIPDVPNQLYRYAEGGPERWRTYFVDSKYQPKTPPNLPDPVYPNDGLVRELILSFHTGSDDLRGGNDNIDLAVDLLDGSPQLYPNINLSARWLPNYTENARVVLSTPVPPEQLHDLVLTDTFGGGIGGDNWDMDWVSVGLLVNGKISTATSTGFHRFSADSTGPKAKTLTIALN